MIILFFKEFFGGNKMKIKRLGILLIVLSISAIIVSCSSATSENLAGNAKFSGNSRSTNLLSGTLVRSGQSYPFTINLNEKTMLFTKQRVTISLRQVTSTKFTGNWVSNGKTVPVNIDTKQQTATFTYDRGITAGLRTVSVEPTSTNIYEGTLVLSGASYPLKVDLFDNVITVNFINGVQTIFIEPTNVNNTNVNNTNANNSFYKGDWVYKGKSISIIFDKNDNVVSFNFPDYPSDIVVVSLERMFGLNPVKPTNSPIPLRSR